MISAPGTSAGQLGADEPAGALTFYSAARVTAGDTSGPPDAVGAQIVSTQAPSACRDDLAFVVLAQAIPGLVPAAIRIDTVTSVGEGVAVWGYGLTEQAGDPVLLRVRNDAYVVAVGPDVATTTTQAAPVRALRVGPGSVTCNGDSGGPVFSAVTGALIGLVSIGSQALVGSGCTDDITSNATTGPVLVDYRDLVLQAFAAAGATPLEETNPSDGGVDAAQIPGDGGPLADAAADGVTEIADGAGSTGDTGDVGPTIDAGGDGPTGNADSAGATADAATDTNPESTVRATGASWNRSGTTERWGPHRELARRGGRDVLGPCLAETARRFPGLANRRPLEFRRSSAGFSVGDFARHRSCAAHHVWPVAPRKTQYGDRRCSCRYACDRFAIKANLLESVI